MSKIDKPKIKKAMSLILEAIGENPKREGLLKTPERMADMYEEIFSGINNDMSNDIKVYSEDQHHEMIIAKNIQFYSMCEHHMLPFFGQVKIAYIPNNEIIGISKLAQISDNFSKRLQLQERLTTQIAEFLMEEINPQGVMVIIEAEHLCMSMRGIKKPGTQIITSAVRGIFQSDNKTRNEALELFKY